MPKLILVKGGMDDWYCIERAEHDGREWLEKVGPNGFALRYSGRISDADVEGTGVEMLAIADAIEARSFVRFKRCAVDARKNPVEFESPRNSERAGTCSLAEADELAKEIRSKLAKKEVEKE